MINFAYKDESGITVGIIIGNNSNLIASLVPANIPYYIYDEGKNVDEVLQSTPSGTGSKK